MELATLIRAVYNVKLYSNKNSMARGWTLWHFRPNGFNVTGFDDYFSITDQVNEAHDLGNQDYFMSLDALQMLEKTLKAESEFDIDDLVFAGSTNTMTENPQPPEGVTEVLRNAQELCFPEGHTDPGLMDSSALALAPDRLRKLSLIKPGTYPIDLKMFMGSDHNDFIAFRCGPTVRGAMAPVNRERLKEMYEDGEIW